MLHSFESHQKLCTKSGVLPLLPDSVLYKQHEIAASASTHHSLGADRSLVLLDVQGSNNDSTSSIRHAKMRRLRDMRPDTNLYQGNIEQKKALTHKLQD